MEIQRHHHLNELEPQEWDQLAVASSPSTVFQTQAWHQAWVDAFGEEHELLLFAAREGGQLVGVAPLCMANNRAVRFIGHGSSDYMDLLVAPGRGDVREALWRHVLDAARGWRRLELRCLQADSPSIAALRSLPARGQLSPPTSCPSLRVSSDMNLQHVRQSNRVERAVRWFMKREGFGVAHERAPSAIHAVLDGLFEQHRRQWSGTATPSLFEQPVQERFFRAVTDRLGPDGSVRCSRLMVEDEAPAHHFGFIHHKTATYYKPCYDAAWAKRSPGVALLGALFDHARDEGLTEFDFGFGAEPYKLQFSNSARSCLHATFYASVVEYGVAKAARAGKDLLRPLVSRVRASARRS